ncbi:MAG: APC family permease [Armatimonadota bacterium]
MSEHATQTGGNGAVRPSLARHIGLGALIIYGVGDMLGAGIYSTIGKAAGTMGNAIWVAFLTSMVAAVLTGLSYASLGSRYPRAAGVAFVTQHAFYRPFLSYVVGLAVIASGLTSMATQARAFAGYGLGLSGMKLPGAEGPLPSADPLLVTAAILVFIGALTFINFWGIRESVWLTVVCALVEVAGLVLIVAVGLRYWGGVNYFETPPPAPGAADGGLTLGLVLQGAVLTFYSFVGFEDMINVTEEVKDPRRNFPIAVLVSIAVVTVVYMLVSVTAVSVVPYAELNSSGQPLVEVVRRAAPAFPPGLFGLVALFAITNTALVNYIMGSRLVYGMARQGLLPRPLSAVHPVRRTPFTAILTLMVIVIVLAFVGSIGQLASATSVLLLCVFMVVNAALLVLQRRPDEPKGGFEIPSFVPVGGVLVCAVMLSNATREALLTAGALLAGIVLLYLVMRPRNLTEEMLAEIEETS